MFFIPTECYVRTSRKSRFASRILHHKYNYPDRFNFNPNTRTGRAVSARGNGGVPVFIEEPPNSYHFTNSTGGSLRCAVAGNDVLPTVTWIMKDGRTIQEASSIF